MEGDLAFGAKHTTQCTDDVTYNCTIETYVIVLTNGTSINLIKI